MEMERKSKSGRIEFLDLAKGIAIIAVVLLHAGTTREDITQVEHPNFLNWLAFFVVPTFFFINGFLYNERSVEHPLKSFWKKFKAYYTPYLCFNICFYLVNNFLVNIHFLTEIRRINGLKNYLKGFASLLLGQMQALTGPMWFLRALIVISALYILIDSASSRLFGGKYRYIINSVISLLLFLLTVFFPVTTTFNFMSGCRYISVYCIGVMYRKYDLNRFVVKKLPVVFLVTLAISVVLANTTQVGLNFSSNYLLAYLAMIISIVMVIAASQLPIVGLMSPVKLVGQHSLYIMALHFLAFKFISLIIIKVYGFEISVLEDIPVIRDKNYSVLWVLAYAIAGLAIPTCVSLISNRIKKRLMK